MTSMAMELATWCAAFRAWACSSYSTARTARFSGVLLRGLTVPLESRARLREQTRPPARLAGRRSLSVSPRPAIWTATESRIS